jgi:hypothetical protein
LYHKTHTCTQSISKDIIKVMATKTKKTPVLQPTDMLMQTVLPGQKSAPGGPILNFLFRSVPSWMGPQWQEAAIWRNFVMSVPVATVCRNTAISQLTALDWKIVARDSNKTDELKSRIRNSTKLLENCGEYDGLDFTGRIEWLGKDLLDLPFGMCAEIGRENDDPSGKVIWIRCLDAGTLMPSLNADFPVIQRVPNMPMEPIPFPAYSIARQYMNPRSDIWREGWGMAPPEQIYLALELMKRGDKYYAELLTNTPQVGILDLGDTTKETAQEWMKEAQDLFSGTDPMKIPVLYEHTGKVDWIPFNMNPNELMFDRVTSRYINLICAGYGMSPSDIGMGGGSNGGETLSGTIRDERKTKKNINSVLKKKFKSFYDRILPDELEFTWIDFDDDQNVARGRARLANAQADEIFTRNHIFAPQELRAQGLVDGLMTVSIPETLDEKSIEWPQSGNTTRPGLIGEKVSADNGGRGEVSSVQASMATNGIIDLKKQADKSVKQAYYPIHDFITSLKNMKPEEVEAWKKHIDDALWWRDPEARMIEDVEKRRRTITGALKRYGLGEVRFDSGDSPKVVDALREKAYLANPDIDYVVAEERIRQVNVENCMEQASNEATDIARSIMATTIFSNLFDELTIDPTPPKDDNNVKIAIVGRVVDKFLEAYPQLMQAAENAGQQILEKILDKEINNDCS